MSTFIRKSHNVSVLLYHMVCGSKYRRAVLNADVDTALREVCLEIALRHEIAFLEIGTDRDHVHFLMQSVPTYSPTKIVRTVKSITMCQPFTAREAFRRVPSLRQHLWGGAFWSSGYFIDTVGRHGSEETLRRYVQQQGCEDEYKRLYQQPINFAPLDAGQMELF